MISKILNLIVGDQNQKTLKRITPLVNEIKTIEEKYKTEILDQNGVLAKTSEFKERIKNGESLDSLLPEAFALVKIACSQLVGKEWEVRGKMVKWEMVPYDVQLIGGIVLHQGNIAEMRTGEGKTLVCTLPVYLNALTGKGVFVVTVNDYLAVRDAEWMKGLYNHLGLSVGVIINDMDPEAKKIAYACDITYGTNNEFGFDYLRDNMARNPDHIVQKHLHYAIVDEVDSILIDEARTPLIISAPAEESTSRYQKYAELIPRLEESTHYTIDEKSKAAYLNEEGVTKMEQLLGLSNIYTEAGFSEVHHIEQALKAHTCYKKDVDYIIQDGEIVIIDEFTGRLMSGRRYSQGLHQAIEAKEKVEIKRESKTLATITFQNYFRLFEKLAGMTGTAATEAEEFYQIYGLDTITIPTNKPVARIDKTDAIYKNRKGKYLSIAKKIKELHEKGQPVLVGTISVEKSEAISQLLTTEKIPHNVLNAKHHEREAEIIAAAGEKGAVTIATNMAGRGTDIKISEEIKELGGLFVLGTERHESRRIDNQLRGRSGRQGDQGESQFFISAEDDLIRLFGGERIQSVMEFLKVPEDMPIENSSISKSIEGAQKKVEGRNFDIRKHLVEYDDVINIHRTIIYKKRQEYLKTENLRLQIEEMINEISDEISATHCSSGDPKEWNIQELVDIGNAISNSEVKLSTTEFDQFDTLSDLKNHFANHLLKTYETRTKNILNSSVVQAIEKAILLQNVDNLWVDHIDALNDLRENVAFSGYAQKNPLIEYKSQAFQTFNELLANIRRNTINDLLKVDFEKIAPIEILPQEEERNLITNEKQVESEITTSHIDTKVGRNDPCPCGSGKKFKKCHG